MIVFYAPILKQNEAALKGLFNSLYQLLEETFLKQCDPACEVSSEQPKLATSNTFIPFLTI